jgi:hypothetical protein
MDGGDQEDIKLSIYFNQTINEPEWSVDSWSWERYRFCIT